MSQEEEEDGRDENAEESPRREEAMRRNMDFIVRHQAQFAADLQSLRETQARSEERWARTEEGIRSLLTIAEIHEREITALGETTRALSETTQGLSETTQGLSEMTRALREATRDTDERLNALINMVEQYISERRNGKKD